MHVYRYIYTFEYLYVLAHKFTCTYQNGWCELLQTLEIIILVDHTTRAEFFPLHTKMFVHTSVVYACHTCTQDKNMSVNDENTGT